MDIIGEVNDQDDWTIGEMGGSTSEGDSVTDETPPTTPGAAGLPLLLTQDTANEEGGALGMSEDSVDFCGGGFGGRFHGKIKMGAFVLRRGQGNDIIREPPPVKRRSLPVPTMGLQMKINKLRRKSDRLKFVSEGSTTGGCGTSSSPSSSTSLTKVQVIDGVLRVPDQSEIGLISQLETGEKLTHLIYGDGNTGFGSSKALPDELIVILGKTPDLQTLELRGFWNFENLPLDFIEYLACFPRLQFLNKLVLPRAGHQLDKMGSILVGIFGSQLTELVCPVEFLEGCCPSDVSKLTPNLKRLTIFETTLKLMVDLLETTWKLDSLELGQFRVTIPVICYGIPISMMEALAKRIGKELKRCRYMFFVTDTRGDVMEEVDVKCKLREYMPNVDLRVGSS